eukprot:scaffold7958_cov133-Isochrysis_galbana.AAC.4
MPNLLRCKEWGPLTRPPIFQSVPRYSTSAAAARYSPQGSSAPTGTRSTSRRVRSPHPPFPLCPLSFGGAVSAGLRPPNL